MLDVLGYIQVYEARYRHRNEHVGPEAEGGGEATWRLAQTYTHRQRKGSLLHDTGASPVPGMSSRGGWGCGREVQDGDACIHRADSLWCTNTNTAL